MIALAGIIIIEALLVYIAYRTHIGVASALALLVIGCHVFYLPVRIFTSLSREWRKTAPLWLQLPQSGWSLLSAKLISGLLPMVALFVIASAFSWWIIRVDAFSKINVPIHTVELLRLVVFGTIVFFWFSITMAVWVSVISISMQAVKNQFRGWRWVIGLAIAVFAIWGIGWFESSALYNHLLGWGAFHFSIGQIVIGQDRIPGQLGPFYFGEWLFNVVLVAVVFYVCGLLLDKRVEVASHD